MADFKRQLSRIVVLLILVAWYMPGSGANMNKFEWQASESAPKNYPMKIVAGDLYYHDGSGSLYVPDKSLIKHGWGKAISSHIVGEDFKPLPDRLKITFFSYTENQFYEGDFKLPYDKILNLFKEGYYSPGDDEDVTYSQIVVGVAPGGVVSVWLRGVHKVTEVFSGNAKPIEGNWSLINSNPDYSREEYVRLGIEESISQEALEHLKKYGVPTGQWSDYRVVYQWHPLFTGLSIRHNRIDEIRYYNGEQDYIDCIPDNTFNGNPKPVPGYIRFVWEYAPGKGRMFELTFFEEEIFDAFKKLGSDNQTLYLEMLMEKVDGERKFSVALRNEKESIKLKRTNLETFSVRDWDAEVVE